MRKTLIAALAAGALAVPAWAQSMKPGLWEISNKASGGQQEQAMAQLQQQLAQMPPEQRKQMEAMMAQRGMRIAPAGGGMAMRVCMTREMVERNEVPTREGCTSTRQQRGGNTIKVAFTCASPPSSGEGEVSFTPESYTSHMVVKSKAQGREDTMVVDATGKWLQADCGDVKPITPRK
jgi:hypothetical protein